MDKIIDTSEYGICLFSLEKMTDFLKDNKVKSSKVLKTFQKKDKLYIKSQEEGIWTPISQIGVSKVIIKIAGFDDEFSSDWNKDFEYSGFNIIVKDGLWIADIGVFLAFDETTFVGEGTEIAAGLGIKKYFSNKERWYETLDGKRIYSAFKYDVPDGKYSVSISGYSRIDKSDIRAVNRGYNITFNPINEFDGYLDPRDSRFDFSAVI